jgi:WD40 repeat protein
VSPAAAASLSPAPSANPTATPVPAPQYGALEMVYQGRAAALAPIYLLRRDFTIDEDPAVLAQDANLDVHRHAWSPDGRVGAGLLADVLVSIEPGKEKRRLGDGISTLTFGADATTVYAVRVTEDGGNDVASVLAINFTSGDTEEVASVSYLRPSLKEQGSLREAQFLDDGGPIRIFWMEDDTLLLYSTGAGTWAIDPASGEAAKLEGDLPQLWSADGHHHITISDKDGTSTLALSNGAGAQLATATIAGLVSHLRWSPDGKQVVFTVGHSASGGGVLQDLYLWNLKDGNAPMQVTSTGAAFGAEWLGTAPHWAAAG